jgi:hypothetical protein
MWAVLVPTGITLATICIVWYYRRKIGALEHQVALSVQLEAQAHAKYQAAEAHVIKLLKARLAQQAAERTRDLKQAQEADTSAEAGAFLVDSMR